MSKQQYRNDDFKIVTEIQKFDISLYQILYLQEMDISLKDGIVKAMEVD